MLHLGPLLGGMLLYYYDGLYTCMKALVGK